MMWQQARLVPTLLAIDWDYMALVLCSISIRYTSTMDISEHASVSLIAPWGKNQNFNKEMLEISK